MNRFGCPSERRCPPPAPRERSDAAQLRQVHVHAAVECLEHRPELAIRREQAAHEHPLPVVEHAPRKAQGPAATSDRAAPPRGWRASIRDRDVRLCGYPGRLTPDVASTALAREQPSPAATAQTRTVAVMAPFDVLRCAVMAFDSHQQPGQRCDLIRRKRRDDSRRPAVEPGRDDISDPFRLSG